jgi:hypothetical protein
VLVFLVVQDETAESLCRSALQLCTCNAAFEARMTLPQDVNDGAGGARTASLTLVALVINHQPGEGFKDIAQKYMVLWKRARDRDENGRELFFARRVPQRLLVARALAAELDDVVGCLQMSGVRLLGVSERK